MATQLDARFRDSLSALGVTAGTKVLAAVSGGADSVVLLHLLRFGAGEMGITVIAAHFDHAMRDDSAADAAWVEGLCASWGVPLVRGRAETPPRTEAEAREARYAFLTEAREQAGADWIATAHHADDQAETVLFRVLRGTGIAGLAGIAPVDEGRRLLRSLLLGRHSRCCIARRRSGSHRVSQVSHQIAKQSAGVSRRSPTG